MVTLIINGQTLEEATAAAGDLRQLAGARVDFGMPRRQPGAVDRPERWHLRGYLMAPDELAAKIASGQQINPDSL